MTAKKIPLPSQEELKSRLIYNPDSGKLFWKPRPLEDFAERTDRPRSHSCNAWNSRWADKEAFTAETVGYKVGRFNGRNYLAHRIVWKMVFGEEPEEIDHKDRNRSNNRLENLVNGDSTTNNMNLPRSSLNTSGVTGISWTSARGKWSAEIQKYKTRYRKYFDDFEAACAWRKEKEAELGFSETHGS